MRRVTQKEMENVWRLDGDARFRRFVKGIAAAQAAWGLWEDGWALLADDDGNQVFPLWPDREYADACRIDGWQSYITKEVLLDDLLDDLLPRLHEQKIRIAVFPTPGGKDSPTIDGPSLAVAVREELTRYA